MRVAHLIMAHKNPEQLIRLIKKLEHSEADFFIHLDKKVECRNFKKILSIPRVIFIKNRNAINWGGNSTVMAILGSVKEILESEQNYDFINLLSGQDYPLRSTQEIHDYLEKNKGTNFISYDEGSEWWQGAKNRYRKYHFTDFNFKGKFFAERLVNFFTTSRTFPLKTRLYGGAKGTWWTITPDCASYLCNVVANDAKLNSFLKFCWGSDEFLVSTLIMNSEFKNCTVNNNLRYIFFPKNAARPKDLTIQDFNALISSNMLFSRKFEAEQGSEILDKIDSHINNN
ncbi:MAG: glycosyltransferase [Pedobacter sp.]|nr:MAG: glycosyltransferase [Pedobacter sp.]